MAPGETTRRLTTIVAADVAGFSRLTAANEEGTLTALRGHRAELIDPKLAEHQGRIANTAGDSLLIEFSSVVEAMRCALDIQQGMEERNRETPEDWRITFRIGINVGDVIDQDGDLLGDGVNVAARLEGLAEPGGICLSRAARDQIRDRMDVAMADMGDIEVKNIGRPVRTFKVLMNGESGGKAPSAQERSIWPAAAAAVLAAIVLLTGALFWWQPWRGNGATGPIRRGQTLNRGATLRQP